MKILMINYPPEALELVKSLRALGLKVEVLYEDIRQVDVDLLKVYDIVYISHVGPEPLLAISTLIRHQNRRPMVVYGNLEPLIATPYRLSNIIYDIKSMLRLAILKFLKIEAIHVLNSFEYKVLRYMKFKNVFLIPYGISKPELSTSLVKAPVFTMVYVTPEYRKGADIVYKVFSYLIEKGLDIKLSVVLGRGFLKKPFLDLSKKFPHNVELYHILKREELIKLIASSHLLLFPSRWEVWGRVVIESLSVGTPVICFNIPGACQDVVNRYKHLHIGYVAKPFSINDFTKGILLYYNLWRYKPEYYYDFIAANAKKIASTYYSNISRRYLEMFQKILGNVL